MAHVLIVDDTPEARLILRTTLQSVGHTTSEAANGRAALDRLRRGGVDLVITDGLMPVMDGFRLCLEMRRDADLASIPVIFYTASFTEPDDMRLASTMGADVYLTKPADADTIIRTVEKTLLRAPRQRHLAELAENPLTEMLEDYGERIEDKLDKKVAELRETRGARDAFRTLLDHLPLLVVTTDAEGRTDYFNRTALEFFGEEGHARQAGGLTAAVHAEDAETLATAVRTALDERRPVEVTVRLLREDGHYRTVRLTAQPYHGTDGEFLGLVAGGVDVTEEEQHRELLRFLAEHDVLTDLPNRRVLDERFERVLCDVASGSSCALLFIDIDRFKSVNDEFGHDVGDAVIASVARTIRDNARPDDLVVRLCGDEFVVLAEDVDRQAAESIAESIRAAVAASTPVPFAPERRVTVSIGVNVVPDSSTPSDALRAADRAMYQAKEQGRDAAVTAEGATVAAGEQTAVAASATEPRLVVTFEPVYALGTGTLARCAARPAFHVDSAVLTQDEVMSDAMRHGLARRFSTRVAEHVLDAMAGTDLACSLPLSLADAFDAAAVERLEHEALRRSVDPGRLAIEVPFAYIAENSLSATWLRTARRSRVRLILDVPDTSHVALTRADLSSFSEIQMPVKTLLAEDARVKRGAAPELLTDLPVTAFGVGSRHLLIRTIAAGARYAAGEVFGGGSEDLGALPRKVEVG